MLQSWVFLQAVYDFCGCWSHYKYSNGELHHNEGCMCKKPSRMPKLCNEKKIYCMNPHNTVQYILYFCFAVLVHVLQTNYMHFMDAGAIGNTLIKKGVITQGLQEAITYAKTKEENELHFAMTFWKWNWGHPYGCLRSEYQQIRLKRDGGTRAVFGRGTEEESSKRRPTLRTIQAWIIMHIRSWVVDMHLRAFLTLGFNPFAPNNTNSTPSRRCMQEAWKWKRSYYEERVIEMEQGSLIPLVISATGGMQGNHSHVSIWLTSLYTVGEEGTCSRSPCMSWLRCFITFWLPRSMTTCIWGSHSTRNRPGKSPNIKVLIPFMSTEGDYPDCWLTYNYQFHNGHIAHAALLWDQRYRPSALPSILPCQGFGPNSHSLSGSTLYTVKNSSAVVDRVRSMSMEMKPHAHATEKSVSMAPTCSPN